ncbi:MAG: hypothetical protein HETSPECPRED_007254 [Heterodermia speciosa]|uniref:Uncharacterized protein n=1 Tax=Heterodermia speciosa TaxID=116794 RepID=A0A8H3IVY1_9LECA|nr:MAG: hypothetical protein HETSPECPRED_007254 [Heterodermia speciosa]
MASKTIVLVSGANQGLGYEMCKKLATEQPDFHILVASRDDKRGREAAATLQDLQGTVEAVQLDISKDNSIEACVKWIDTKFGRLDVLINNAAISDYSVRDEPTIRAMMQKCFDTNVFGTASLTDACVPLLQKGTVPRIVFVSSEMGSVGNTLDPKFPYYGAHYVSYKASKSAVNMLGAMYAVKHGKDGFKVNVCCPGLRATNFAGPLSGTGGDPEEGAINACRLATVGADGEMGTFTNLEGTLPW